MNQKVAITFTETGKYPLQKTDLFINDRYIQSSNGLVNQFTFVPKDIEGVNVNGTNTIKLVVYDNVLNQNSTSTDFIVNQ